MTSADIKVVLKEQNDINYKILEGFRIIMEGLARIEHALREYDAAFDRLLDKE